MPKEQRELLVHAFKGPRFDDHGLDVDVLPELVTLKTLLVESAKDLWRAKHPERERLPKNFEDSLNLKFYELLPGSTAVPLLREITWEDGELPFSPPPDELDEAAVLLAETVDAAEQDAPLPERFPKRLLGHFSDYGKTLGDGEWFEHQLPQRTRPAKYSRLARQRLIDRVSAPYEDAVDVTGTVTMARVSKPRMALQLPDGSEVEAAFRPEDEEVIITALKEHVIARLRVEGRGDFRPDGTLDKVSSVDRVTFLPSGELEFDPNAKPIWEEFDEVLSTVPKDRLKQLPRDAAEHHDRYIYGVAEDAL